MPKNKFQEVVFTVIMVFFMVYSMICYNIRLNVGEMTNSIFLSAFHELIIMGPIAFVLDFFIVSKLAFACASRMVDFRNCHPFSMILAISVASIALMCPLMSFAATLLFKNAGSQFIAVWIETTAMNFPAAFLHTMICKRSCQWQVLCIAMHPEGVASGKFSVLLKKFEKFKITY